MTRSNETALQLTDLLDGLADEGNDRQVSLRDLLSAFGPRAFGPMLVIPAFVAVAPTGAIPGMSLLTGSLIFLIAVQLLFAMGSPWLPKRLTGYELPQAKLKKSVGKLRPYARRVDRFMRPRLEFLTDFPFLQIIALACCVMALLMFPLALLPFAVAVPGTSVFLLGLGVTARDGVLILAGLVFSLAALGLFFVWFL